MAYQPLPIKNEDDAFTNGDKGVTILGVRQDADTSPVSANGDYHTFIFNELGRLKVAGSPAQYNAVTGSVALAAQTVFADVNQVSNVMAYCTGTFNTVNCIFEGSLDSTNGTDGTWFTIQAVRSSSNTIETTTGNLSAAPTYAWELSVNALSWFRVRCTARTSGTQNWILRLGSYATEPIPAAQVSATQPVSGTVTATVASTTIAASASVVGLSWYYNGALSNTDVTVKAAAGRVYGYDFYNPNTSGVYVQFFNALIASVTPGSTAPTFSLFIPALSGRDMYHTVPKSFATAITICATTTATGGTAPTLPIEARVDYL